MSMFTNCTTAVRHRLYHRRPLLAIAAAILLNKATTAN